MIEDCGVPVDRGEQCADDGNPSSYLSCPL